MLTVICETPYRFSYKFSYFYIHVGVLVTGWSKKNHSPFRKPNFASPHDVSRPAAVAHVIGEPIWDTDVTEDVTYGNWTRHVPVMSKRGRSKTCWNINRYSITQLDGLSTLTIWRHTLAIGLADVSERTGRPRLHVLLSWVSPRCRWLKNRRTCKWLT